MESAFSHPSAFIGVHLWPRNKTKSAGESSPPSKVLTGPARPGARSARRDACPVILSQTALSEEIEPCFAPLDSRGRGACRAAVPGAAEAAHERLGTGPFHDGSSCPAWRHSKIEP